MHQPLEDVQRISLERLPLDLLLESVLPHFSVSSLASLAQSNRAFKNLIEGAGGESVWRLKLVQDFSFPVRATGRRNGFRQLYQRVTKQRTYVWGLVMLD